MLRVVVEDLLASGVAVTGSGEDLAAAWAASEAGLHAARPGWQGRSGMAVAALGERWAEHSRAAVVGLGDLAEGLFAAARAFRLNEQGGAEELSSPG